MRPSIDEIVEFWFGHDSDDPEQLQHRYELWFRADPAFDAIVRERFGAAVADAAAGKLADWSGTARGTLALIVLLDQFPRNIHRGTADAFACDPLALAYCHSGLARGFDVELKPVERSFFYLPLEHAESIAEQTASVAAFTRLVDEAPAAFRRFAGTNLDYAVEHYELIERFGRFPHRNAVLGRHSSAAERTFLESTANRFGQG
tara:strand:+ start:5532 stop:6143 length:612 start_codon:yes stop_codon:yes gene_type:complete